MQENLEKCFTLRIDWDESIFNQPLIFRRACVLINPLTIVCQAIYVTFISLKYLRVNTLEVSAANL